MGAKYYSLVASLPYMPPLEKAQRLPLTQPRLQARLKVLPEEDVRQLDALSSVLRLHSRPVGLTDAEVIDVYRKALASITHPMLRDLLEYRMEQMTMMAALRRRHRLGHPPATGTPWGISGRTRWLVKHWESPDFGLGHVYSWLAEARQHLESGNALALQTLLWQQLWRRVTSYQQAEPFGLGDVFGWVLKWNILQLWLGQDADSSAHRFEELTQEVSRDKLAFV